MATFKLETYPARFNGGDRFSVVFALDGRPDPFPAREIEARTPREALDALEAYKRDVAAAVSTPVAVSLRVKRGSRAPNGWKAAEKANPPYHAININ